MFAISIKYSVLFFVKLAYTLFKAYTLAIIQINNLTIQFYEINLLK